MDGGNSTLSPLNCVINWDHGSALKLELVCDNCSCDLFFVVIFFSSVFVFRYLRKCLAAVVTVVAEAPASAAVAAEGE